VVEINVDSVVVVETICSD